MTKHEALKDLAAVLRDAPVRAPRVESGPGPLSPALRYASASSSTAPGSTGSSLFSQLLPAVAGQNGGGSILSGLLSGGGSTSPRLPLTLGSLAGDNPKAGAGLGLSPLLSGLLSLFGSGSKSAPPPLPLYSAPQRVQLREGLQGGVVRGSDSSAQFGLPRVALPGTSAGANPNASQPQVTLHIQALDTQSILNRSTDIAQAVRQAMLQSHPINDVVADL